MSETEREHLLEWNDRLQDWLDGDLDERAAAAFEAHLASCSHCRRYVQELRGLDQALHAASPPLALDPGFDARIFSQIETFDESKRAAARKRVEQELQQNLKALSRRWRRTLAMLLPGVAAGIAITFALTAWLGQSELTRHLVMESATGLGWDTSGLIQAGVTMLFGTGLGLLLARWFSSVIE
jgi:anti-sigma factor RsiW